MTPPARIEDIAPVNWPAILYALVREGYTYRSIAVMLTVSRQSVARWLDGAEPRHREGERLVALWCEVTGSSRDRIPMLSTMVPTRRKWPGIGPRT